MQNTEGNTLIKIPLLLGFDTQIVTIHILQKKTVLHRVFRRESTVCRPPGDVECPRILSTVVDIQQFWETWSEELVVNRLSQCVILSFRGIIYILILVCILTIYLKNIIKKEQNALIQILTSFLIGYVESCCFLDFLSGRLISKFFI